MNKLDYFSSDSSYCIIGHYKSKQHSLFHKKADTSHAVIKKIGQTITLPFFGIAAIFASIHQHVEALSLPLLTNISKISCLALAILSYSVGRKIFACVKFFQASSVNSKLSNRQQWEKTFDLHLVDSSGYNKGLLNTDNAYGNCLFIGPQRINDETEKTYLLNALEKFSYSAQKPYKILVYSNRNTIGDVIFKTQGNLAALNLNIQNEPGLIRMVHIPLDREKASEWKNSWFLATQPFRDKIKDYVMTYEEWCRLQYQQRLSPSLREFFEVK